MGRGEGGKKGIARKLAAGSFPGGWPALQQERTNGKLAVIKYLSYIQKDTSTFPCQAHHTSLFWERRNSIAKVWRHRAKVGIWQSLQQNSHHSGQAAAKTPVFSAENIPRPHLGAAAAGPVDSSWPSFENLSYIQDGILFHNRQLKRAIHWTPQGSQNRRDPRWQDV